MPDFIKLAIYGAFAPKDYNPDAYNVDEEDRKDKKNKDKDATDKDATNKDATDNDDRSSVSSFETSASTVVEKDGKTTARHHEKEKADSLKSPEIAEGSSQSKAKSKPKRRVKLHDAGPSGAKGVFASMFGNHGYADGRASIKW